MYKRKTYVIDKEFQFGFIATFLILVVLALLLFSAGFLVFYWLTYMTGENIFDEYITITKQITIQIQPFTEDNITDEKSLLSDLKDSTNKVSAYIFKNLPAVDQTKINMMNANNKPEKKELSEIIYSYLQSTVRYGIEIYSEDRFEGITVSDNVLSLAKSSPAGENLYKTNMQLLAAVYKNSLKVEKTDSQAGLTKMFYQQEIPGLKRHELILPPLLINNLLLMILIIVIGLIFSHRIAGPVYRMNADIKRAIDGEEGVVIRLRKKDSFKNLADSINNLINKLDELRKKK